MDMGDQLRFGQQRTPLDYPPLALRSMKENEMFWELFLTSRPEATASLEEVEVDAPSPDLRNRESAAALSRARKETTNELELKISQREEESLKLLLMEPHRLHMCLRSRLEMASQLAMASQQEVEVDAPLPNIRNRESAAAHSHVRKETYINELELKVSQLEEENSKLKEAKANQFTTAFASSKKECKKTQTKIGLGLNLEDLEPHFGKRLEDVAEELDVGRSTIKRACRNYGINRWPCNKKNKSNPTNGISCRDSQQNTPPSASSKNVTMKVRFEDDTIKFDFCLSSGMGKLLSEVGRKLSLKVGGFKLKYLDEDGDDILLACDDDLQFYLKSLATVVEKTCIKLFVHL